jgi:hypothetical protein
MFFSALIGGWLFPWWWPALTAYIIGFWFHNRASGAFVTGFVGTASAWLAWASYQDWRNHHLLAGRIANLFHLPSVAAVLAITALLGGLTGGFGAWAGFALGAYLKPKFRPSP